MKSTLNRRRLSQRFYSVVEAELARNALEASGIHASLDNEHMGSVAPHSIHALGGISILVLEENFEQAEILLSSGAGVALEDIPSLDLPKESGEKADDEPEVDKIILRATQASILGSFILPAIANLVSTALYWKAMKLDRRRFLEKPSLWLLGMTFNVVTLALATVYLYRRIVTD